jgi:deoxyribonuclease V
MILAVDVYYTDDFAQVAGAIFEDWSDNKPLDILTTRVVSPSDYQPGELFKRELPCILKLMSYHALVPEIVIVDGYVFLDGHSEPGLGKHLHDALSHGPNVIGIAKNRFQGISTEYEVFRGGSSRPLFVTSFGVSLDEAQTHVRQMHGPHRIPTLLALVDAASKAI